MSCAYTGNVIESSAGNALQLLGDTYRQIRLVRSLQDSWMPTVPIRLEMRKMGIVVERRGEECGDESYGEMEVKK